MWDHPQALLPSYNVPGIMSPRDNNVLLLIWLENVNCLLWWTIVTAVIDLLFIFQKNGRYSWQQENWSRENQRIQREEWASCKAECFEIPSENCPEKGNWQWFWQGIQRKTSWQKKKISGNESLFGPIHHIRHICHAGTLYKNRFFIHLGCFQSLCFHWEPQ